MRVVQWLIVIPLFLFAAAPAHDWSSSMAVVFITPLLWVPLAVTVRLQRYPRPRVAQLFTVSWWVCFVGYGATVAAAGFLGEPNDTVRTVLTTVMFIMLAAWIASLITGVVWQIMGRKER
ncbi:hypothetical protein [Microbacterium sp. YY-01]|uniref:hypothetical protein n=1 Tax=Microbacterium sp. YY-01 TaxID=3421634 RepID=UPI003D17FB4F